MVRSTGYTLYLEGKRVRIPESQNPLLSRIDRRGDRIIDNREIVDYLKETRVLHERRKANLPKLTADFKRNLLRLPPRQASLYPNYNEYVNRMRTLEARFSKQAKMVPLGEIDQGLTLYALKIVDDQSLDTSNRPAMLFTGLTHAREWATGMVTLETAEKLLDGLSNNDAEAKRRLEQAELWFVPVLNVRGYDYSLTTDSWWRKNRDVIYQDETACPPPGAKHTPVGEGVDLNRNYGTPNAQYYRTSGDSACSTRDDYGASDAPGSDTYRGRGPASTRETQLLQNFILNKPNLKAILDHHSFGGMILYPWGYTRQPVDNVQEYREAAGLMNQAGGGDYDILQGIDLYPTTGTIDDFAHANGIFTLTIELGSTFHPDDRELRELLKSVPKMDLALMDWVIKNRPVGGKGQP